jgi:streptomycin 6-kinase
MFLPEKLRKLAQHPTGARWLARLPETVADLVRQWDLQLGEPFAGGNVSYVAPAVRGKDRVVLKVQWPWAGLRARGRRAQGLNGMGRSGCSHTRLAA